MRRRIFGDKKDEVTMKKVEMAGHIACKRNKI
jgi:hypothetical protein